MKIELDGARVRITIDDSFTAAELEALLIRLAITRSRMQPPVPEQPPNPSSDPDQPILMENGAAVTAALRQAGGFRIWMRNRGFGWIGYEVETLRATGLAKFILSRAGTEGVDLFGADDSQRH